MTLVRRPQKPIFQTTNFLCKEAGNHDFSFKKNNIFIRHEHTTTAYPELVSLSYDQEDDRATKSYYLPNIASNITVGFNMPMDTDWAGNSPFEML